MLYSSAIHTVAILIQVLYKDFAIAAVYSSRTLDIPVQLKPKTMAHTKVYFFDDSVHKNENNTRSDPSFILPLLTPRIKKVPFRR